MAQTPPGAAPAKPAMRRPPAYPERPPADPAMLERGKALYGIRCTFCHGADARGGSGGPNLLRAELVLNDKDGELIAPVIRNGREGMPKMDLTQAQIADIAAFIHSFKVGGYDISRMTPLTIVTGDAKAGEAYFANTCARCHSTGGDLKGLASRIPDAKALQQTWLIPGSGRGEGTARPKPITVAVTPPGGKRVEGRLVRVDDFLVTLIDSDGARRTFSRDGDVPKVELKDPLQPHKDLLKTYADKDIHNVTAFLVTVK
ncbi:MAG: cytochrome c [Acidobacteria bacterium]|nr:cytochrome c [Acidobacteriota bacterium]